MNKPILTMTALFLLESASASASIIYLADGRYVDRTENGNDPILTPLRRKLVP